MGKIADDEADKMLAMLEAHFGEPVMPVSRYCGALRSWRDAIRANADKPGGSYLEPMVKCLEEFELYAVKSNLLFRLIYRREQVRPEPCPEHKGRWSGCVWGDRECPHCMSGANVTGWIKPSNSVA